ncbi:glycosyltransferase [Labrys monachus]|uniref:Glycosyltransferase involved in cell wall biosynthesis n=1 Tax=Labrys monachus TaxID=217067 RepID=A0ABU0FA09_9HYPH|nr:glycosyltransferase [Labrys monachus]MDQ0391449.1 glycosyltransferase involved in cell wall biosynthesis [Labrys monachus]
MRVAIIHYWLVGMRGGEKVLEALCDMFPNADIYTHVVVPSAISDRLKAHSIKTSFIARLPRAAKMYKSYLPLMPLALEHLDLRGYDLVISSESGPAKGIIPPPSSVHVCYCHSPMRYIWNMYHDYREGAGPVARLAMPLLSHYLRSWDESSASRVDHFVANSHTVANRVRKYYRRQARVIHPPVAVDDFSPVPDSEIGDYHLMVGELVSYKRPDLAVEAFNRSGRKLVVIGGGEMLKQISRMAGPTVQVLGPQPFDVLRHHYAHCRALVFPGEEDFGIIPVEAMASGRPVVAFGRGGATETVLDGTTGLLFEEQTVDSLMEAVERLDTMPLDRTAILRHAQRFNPARFRREMEILINQALAENAAPVPAAAGEIGLVPAPARVGGLHG